MKQIAPEQALALSLTPSRYYLRKLNEPVSALIENPRFIRPGETQKEALKRLRSSSLGKTIRKSPVLNIPYFRPGITTAAAYVTEFERINNLVYSGSSLHLNKPSPVQPSRGEEEGVQLEPAI